MKKNLMVASIALLQSASLLNAQTVVQFPVAPQNPPYFGLWTNTGISVTNGEWINVNADGLWNPASTDGGNVSIPDGTDDGDPDLFLGNTLHASLIAYVGSDPFQGEWTTNGNNTFFPQTVGYWQLGTSRQFASTTNGNLWLGFNDDAVTASVDDNAGAVTAAISLGVNASLYDETSVVLGITSVSSDTFTFFISNGVPSSVCAIYDSSDLQHWTLIDALMLDTNGSLTLNTNSLLSYKYNNSPAVAPNPLLVNEENNTALSYQNTTGVPYRFYKVTDGPFVSKTIGYATIMVGPGITNGIPDEGGIGTNGLVSDPFISMAANTLDGLFNPMPDGSFLPNGSQILIELNGGSGTYYTWNDGWGGNGGVSFNPGEAAFVIIHTNVAWPVTFAGIVAEGASTLPTINGYCGSLLPKAGGIQSNLEYNPTNDDTISLYAGPTAIWRTSYYISGHWSTYGEPFLQVGQGFRGEAVYTNNSWTQYYSSHQF